jgi:hypothetical protein
MVKKEDHDIWLKTWMLSAGGAPGSAHALLTALLRLPEGTTMPPAMVVVKVIKRAMEQTLHEKESDFVSMAQVLENTVDIIRNRLIVNVTDAEDPGSIMQEMESLSGAYAGLFGKVVTGSFSNADISRRVSVLMQRNQDLSDYVEKLSEVKDARANNPMAIVPTGSDVQALAWQGWHDATVGWLLSGEWHGCEVPELGCCERYKTSTCMKTPIAFSYLSHMLSYHAVTSNTSRICCECG